MSSDPGNWRQKARNLSVIVAITQRTSQRVTKIAAPDIRPTGCIKAFGSASALIRARACFVRSVYSRGPHLRAGYTADPGPANGLSLSCTARAHVPKPTRRGGCRRGVAEPRLAICNRRDAAHSCMLTRQLGCRASAGPCRLLARVSQLLLRAARLIATQEWLP
jgi:hypothetical protein